MIAEQFLETSAFVWHQRFRLGDDVYSPGTSDVEWLLDKAQIPRDLSGRSVLDVGTANGGVAFEAERRGATRVVGVDVYPPDWFGFEQTREFLGSGAEFVQSSIYGLPEMLGGETFDLVFFWGVLYHLRHPLLALDELRRLTRTEASIETELASIGAEGANLVQFHRTDELAGDSSNWFVPTLDTLVAWCASSGFAPEVLGVWPPLHPTRGIVRALVAEGDPEYLSLSYELPLRVVEREPPMPADTVTTAPRLIDWTGERCVPWGGEIQGIYEHLHRYYFAREFAAGRRVLDLGSGEGYGAAILAQVAEHVSGIDIDAQTVAHSRGVYDLANLEFVEGSMLDLDAYAGASFGLVTCFEAIEHIAEQEALLAAIARVLAEDGVFIVSTPDRETYNAGLQEPNPFHVRELNGSELLRLLAPHFMHVSLWGQSSVGGSRLALVEASDDSRAGEVLVLPQEDLWRETAAIEPTFFVAVASREPLPLAPTRSYLLDPSLQALHEAGIRAGPRAELSSDG